MSSPIPARPRRAILLAAGLGQRMRPITDRMPKPLVEVGGRTMLDHALDRLADAGVGDVIVNVHHFPEQVERQVAKRARPRIAISDERAQLLETGGGVKKALPLLGDGPFIAMNSDSLWIERGASALDGLIGAWDPARMDMLLLLARLEETFGFDGAGDFTMDESGALARRSGASAPFVFAGVSITTAPFFENTPDGAFSLNLLFDRAVARRRLFGHALTGTWLHVGAPDAIAPANAMIDAAR